VNSLLRTFSFWEIHIYNIYLYCFIFKNYRERNSERFRK
jgi:hypothetical protein